MAAAIGVAFDKDAAAKLREQLTRKEEIMVAKPKCDKVPEMPPTFFKPGAAADTCFVRGQGSGYGKIHLPPDVGKKTQGVKPS